MNQDVPEWLHEVRSQHPSTRTIDSGGGIRTDSVREGVPLVGGVFRILPMDPGTASALGIVTEVDTASQSARVVLVTADLEFGGSKDVLLPSDQTGLGYPLLAEVDVFGYVWLVQLESLGISASSEAMSAIRAVEREDYTDHPLGGQPVTRRNDARWSFKKFELERLQALSASCTRQLVDGDAYMTVDPKAFEVPTNEVEALALSELVVTAFDAAMDGRLSVPSWLIDMILSPELVDSYCKAGFFDIYRGLVSLATIQSDDSEGSVIPDGFNSDSEGSSLDSAQETLIQVASSEGISAIWLLALSTEVPATVCSQLRHGANDKAVQVTFCTSSTIEDRMNCVAA